MTIVDGLFGELQQKQKKKFLPQKMTGNNGINWLFLVKSFKIIKHKCIQKTAIKFTILKAKHNLIKLFVLKILKDQACNEWWTNEFMELIINMMMIIYAYVKNNYIIK